MCKVKHTGGVGDGADVGTSDRVGATVAVVGLTVGEGESLQTTVLESAPPSAHTAPELGCEIDHAISESHVPDPTARL